MKDTCHCTIMGTSIEHGKKIGETVKEPAGINNKTRRSTGNIRDYHRFRGGDHRAVLWRQPDNPLPAKRKNQSKKKWQVFYKGLLQQSPVETPARSANVLVIILDVMANSFIKKEQNIRAIITYIYSLIRWTRCMDDLPHRGHRKYTAGDPVAFQRMPPYSQIDCSE